jgi:membrane protein YdbS with pleckstrin-like domain
MYYLWLNEAQAGPYTLLQVQSLWNEGQITALTLYWQEGNADWAPLSDIQSIIEPPVRPALLEKTTVMPTVAQVFVKKAQERAANNPAPVAAPAESHEEHVEWSGSPTWWKWASLLGLILVMCLIPVGVYIFIADYFMYSLATLLVAVLIFIYIYLARSSTKYSVTNKRVSVESGIFNKTSRELRIQDIRSIAAHINFLGYGNIEFSSAASDEVDVVFTAVSGAGAVRDLVKKLQA